MLQLTSLHIEIRGTVNDSSEIVLQKVLNAIEILTNLEKFTLKGNYSFTIGKSFYENFVKIRSNVELVLLTERDEYAVTFSSVIKNGSTILKYSFGDMEPIIFQQKSSISGSSSIWNTVHAHKTHSRYWKKQKKFAAKIWLSYPSTTLI